MLQTGENLCLADEPRLLAHAERVHHFQCNRFPGLAVESAIHGTHATFTRLSLDLEPVRNDVTRLHVRKYRR
jgi:hypothetical protein